MNWLDKLSQVEISQELVYVFLLLGLFVVPRILQRVSVPRAITSLGLGALAAYFLPELGHDPAVILFSTLGIVSLFLFAGLEVEVHELRREARFLGVHLGVGLLVLTLFSFGFARLFGMDARAAALVGLAVLTPSAGFILESLDGSAASERERFWIRTKVISNELLALGVLFVTLKSTTWTELALSAVALAGLVIGLPWLFRLFAKLVVPHAPKSEFAFLIMVAVVCALLTKKLGVYYLVGAFVVGMAAQRFRTHLPAMASERMLHAVESFASLFVPFYFFYAGLKLSASDFRLEAILVGLGLLAVTLPLRIAVVSVLRRFVLREGWSQGWRVSISMLPTLIFTLVLAQILREQFDVPGYVFGGLMVYAIVCTVLPTWILHLPPPEFDEPTISDSPSLPPELQLVLQAAGGADAGRPAGSTSGTAAPSTDPHDPGSAPGL